MSQVAVALSVIGSTVIETISNSSVLATIGVSQEGSLKGSILCYDALGELVFGLVSTMFISLEYQEYLIRVYWLALLPFYLFQVFYAVILSIQYCQFSDVTDIQRASFEDIVNSGTVEDYFNYIITLVVPSRLNLLADSVAAAIAIYFNSWIVAAWFLTAIPINNCFEIYFLINAQADMPPMFYFNN